MMTKIIYLGGGTILISAVFITAVHAHEWVAPKEAAGISNPVALSAGSVERGREVFLDNCAACHGVQGNGMSAEDAGLKKDAPNLVKRLTTHTDGDFFWKIKNGRGEMPAFEGDLADQEVWDMVNYIKDEE